MLRATRSSLVVATWLAVRLAAFVAVALLCAPVARLIAGPRGGRAVSPPPVSEVPVITTERTASTGSSRVRRRPSRRVARAAVAAVTALTVAGTLLVAAAITLGGSDGAHAANHRPAAPALAPSTA